MLAYLGRTVVPIVDGWDVDDGDALLTARFDLGLTGSALGLVGEGEASELERALVQGLAALATVAPPAASIQALGNGWLRLAHELGGAHASWWLQAMTHHGLRARSREELLGLGLVLAWRAGLAEAREAALATLAGLDPALRRALFAVGEPDPDSAHRFVLPGKAPGGPLTLLGAVGGFVGFGGPFARPPRPVVVRGRLICTDGAASVELFADAFGARLVPAAWAHAEASSAPVTSAVRVTAEGVLTAGEQRLVRAELVGASAVAAAQGMIAVTLGDSHKVFVVGRVGRP
jgi:hypothetical protein